MEQELANNPLELWIFALGIFLGGTILLAVLRKFVVYRLGKLAEKTKNEVDDLIIEIVRRTRLFFLAVISFYLASTILTLSEPGVRGIHTAVFLGFLLQCAFWGNALINFVLSRAVKRRLSEDATGATTLSSLGYIGRLVLWLVLLLLALDNLGVNITGLAAGLGIGGIAVALALQNVLGDLFASLSIVLDQPFVIGDFVIVGEHRGTVEHIGLKTTRMRSLSGEQLVFSNSDLLQSRIRNYKRMQERRIAFTIGVTYQTTYEQLSYVSRLLKEVVEAQENVRFDRAHFKEYGDFALIYEVVYFIHTSDYNTYMNIQQAINLEIYRRFEQEGIEFAYPTQTVFIHNEVEESTSAKN